MPRRTSRPDIDSARIVKYLGNMQRSTGDEQAAALGQRIRERREARAAEDPRFSLRQLAMRCGVTPAFLSRFERGDVAPPGEEVLTRLAAELGEDPDVMLAMAGKVSSDLRAAIIARPQLFAEVIRAARDMPDAAVLRIVREVRDGDW